MRVPTTQLIVDHNRAHPHTNTHALTHPRRPDPEAPAGMDNGAAPLAPQTDRNSRGPNNCFLKTAMAPLQATGDPEADVRFMSVAVRSTGSFQVVSRNASTAQRTCKQVREQWLGEAHVRPEELSPLRSGPLCSCL